MNKLTNIDKLIAYFIAAWTLLQFFIFMASINTVNDSVVHLLWPYNNGNRSVFETYDLQEFLLYSIIPWASFICYKLIGRVGNPAH